MPDIETLSHTKWDCKHHVVFIPKYRRKALYHELRRHLGEVFRALAAQKECRIEEGHLMGDHVHMLLSIPPKYAVAQVVGYLKGKSAIHIARTYGGRQRNFAGAHFWGIRSWGECNQVGGANRLFGEARKGVRCGHRTPGSKQSDSSAPAALVADKWPRQ